MGVTKMKLTVLLVLALAAIATATPFHRAIGLKGPVEPRCDGPECPGGFCPEPAYICCDNGYFCAATEADCPPIKKEEVKQGCPGTECPGDVVQMPDGSAVLEMNTVLPVKNTVRKPTLLRNSVPWLHQKKLLNKI